MKKENLHMSTRAIHTDVGEKRTNRPVATPIHLSATYESTDYDEQIRLEEEKADTFYMRYGNPTISVAERTLADLEGAEAAAVFGSGMAAITTTLFSFLNKGDHAVFQREIYGGAYRFAKEFLPRWGVEVSWVDVTDKEGFDKAVRENTRLLYVESPTNPTLKVLDIEGVVKIAKKHGVPTFIDSTFATPLNTRPVDYGIDAVLHSVTKYLGGHSDLVGGALIGSSEVVERVKDAHRVLGGILNPHAAYLLIRGLKTIGVRVEQHNRNGLELGIFLEGHPRVRRVFYPHLPSHPQNDLAKRQMRGGGGVVSFEIDGDLETAKRFADALTLVRLAPSLGGVESLLSIPCLTSHAMLSPEEREKAGIRDSLVRIAFGIEPAEDLMADIDQALEASA
jgi:cystathionine beta-lyase/cystathionine gamma-synthase